MSRFHSRGNIVAPDGLSRITLGQAVVGEHAKGERDPLTIAHTIRRLYLPAWLARELANPRARHPKGAHQVLDALLVLTHPEDGGTC